MLRITSIHLILARGDNGSSLCVMTWNNPKANDQVYFMKFDMEVVRYEEAV